ncbi:MAG: hypothetical protein C4293_07815 [Nitrospiraceae bacterium]
MGWSFIGLGLLLIGIGGFLTYYGQDLLQQPPSITQTSGEMPVLSPVQERLLELLADYQKKFTANKLIISRRSGSLHFDDDTKKGSDLSLIKDLYGSTANLSQRATEFEKLMEGMPSEYVRLLGETRFDNPFVVSVTEKGMKYLRSK